MHTTQTIRLDEDHHVHTTFSDGRAGVFAMAEMARRRGLREIGFADHVRAETDWLAGYVREIQDTQEVMPGILLRAGVEAKILDTDGRLDLPDLPPGIEQVVIADHQLPGPHGPLHPRDVKRALEDGEVREDQVLKQLVESTRRAVLTCPREPIVGHLFSVLPKVGIAHGSFDPAWVDPILEACLERSARLEVDERWRSPGPAVVRRALDAGVHVVASTDSHKLGTVGRYRYVRELAGASA